jgi:predicted phosphodiesterase
MNRKELTVKIKNQDSSQPCHVVWDVTRRHFLRASGLAVAGLSASISPLSAAEDEDKTRLSFGIVADAHYADRPGGGRVYRESLVKMAECVKLMNDKKVDFLIELGDFKDQGQTPTEESTLEYLDAIEEVFAQFNGPRYHVLGNHDLDSISKQQFLSHVENTGIEKDASYYSFDSEGVHFVVLDACFTSSGEPYDHGNFGWQDANIPPGEMAWLQQDLAATSLPVIVFIHQLLDGEGAHYVENAAEVRQVLTGDQGVLAVFQGHNHGGHYSHIQGIHYYTLKAMVEGSGEQNNAYAIVDLHEDNSMTVTGYRRAESKALEP